MDCSLFIHSPDERHLHWFQLLATMNKVTINLCVYLVWIQFFKSLYMFSCSVMSDSLRPHELHHARPPYPSPTAGVYSNPCALSQWCIQPSHPLSSPSPPAFSLSQHQGLFQGVSSLHQVAKILEFQLHISPSNEYSGLISFRMDWFAFFAVQGTLKSFLQPHSSKASILLRSAFFIVQPWHPYTTTGKTVALTRRIFVGKVTSLLFNMLSRLGSWLFFQTSISLCPDLCVSNYTHEVCAVCISIILQYAIENIICAEKCPKLNGTAWYIFRE